MATDRRKQAGCFRSKMRRLREDQLVQVTSSLLLRKGCHELRVEDVAAACGVAKGTCYQHFETRPALLAAAVRHLDEILAKRLLSPPAHVSKPRQVFEWAVLEAVDAEIFTLARRHARAKIDAGALDIEGKAWPCCLGLVPCPHGGAVLSLEALRRRTTDLTSRHDARAFAYVTLLLAAVPYYFVGGGHHSQPNPRVIRSTVRQMLKRLFP